MKEYFTDQELERFIEQLEQQQLYAPRHMKEQILSQAFPKQTGEGLSGSGGGEGTVRFFPYHHDSENSAGSVRGRDYLYCIKIIAGMAAALFLLAVLPTRGGGGYEESRSGTRQESQMYYGEEIDEGSTTPGQILHMARNNEHEDGNNGMDINRMLNEGTRRANQRINSWFDRINSFWPDE